jgi:hypothetical protein
MEEFNYFLDCNSCDVKLQLKVVHEDEMPVYCPLCGEDVNEVWQKSDDF